MTTTSRILRGAAAGALGATLVLTAPTVAEAHGRGGPGHAQPASYLLDPTGTAAADVYPEGVAVRGDDFYVSSTTDGTIYRGNVDDPTATPFLPGGADGRTSAVGMKVDRGTLFVAGAATGRVFAYDLRTRALTGSWQVEDTGAPTFLNDIAISPRGDVYVTDSMRPVLYRISAHDRRTSGVETLPTFVDLTGTPFVYQPGFNANGIVVSADGRTAVVAQTNTATLFRIDLRTRGVTPVDLGGEPVAGDGLVLTGRTLYAVAGGAVVRIETDRRLTSGTVVSRTTDPSFLDPTTIALVGPSLLVVNSQFSVRAAGGTPGPFTVSRIAAP